MLCCLSTLLVTGFGASLAAPAPSPADVPFHVVAYVAGWSFPAVIHAEALTDINFAFARISSRGEVEFEQPAAAAANLRSLHALKKAHPRLKIIVSVGGWMADGFSDAALTETSRQRFATSALALLREHALDGIDLDWEYPGQGVAGIKYRAEDKQNFTLLLKTLREHLDAESDARGSKGGGRYVLTIASADREYFDHTEMQRLHVYLDWINIMAYDFFNSLAPTTGHHAGLYRSAIAPANSRFADAAVEQHLTAGIPSTKLVLGVAFYGRGFAGVKAVENGLNQPYERFEAEHSYAELADKYIGKQGFARYWDERAQAPYLWNAATRAFISYDDARSIEIKTRYARQHRLGGIMFWELSQDRNGELLDAITRGRH